MTFESGTVMEGENIYNKIREIFGKVPGSFNILEEQIDIDLQMTYFEVSGEVKVGLDESEVMREKDEIFNPDRDKREKRILFAKLASLENVEAYRQIEKYLKEKDPELKNWAILALQESRMLLESKLLEENQVFISTGLGGKGSRLRYFVVLIHKNGAALNKLQRKVVRNEFLLMLKKYDSEIEEIRFKGTYTTLLVIIPLKMPLQDVFREAIRECNQYGDFLKDNFIITNVRRLDGEEISSFLNRQEQTHS